MSNKIIKILYFTFLTIFIGMNTAYAQTNSVQTSGVSTNAISHYRRPTKEIEQIFKQNLSPDIKVIYTTVPRGLIVSFDSHLFFEEGKDAILNSAKPILDKISSVLKSLSNECIIESNIQTENLCGSCYKTLWELSIIRADEIADYLITTGQIHPSLIRSTGYGELQPLFYAKKEITEMENRIDFVIINYEKTRLMN